MTCTNLDGLNRCRWDTDSSEKLLYVKYDINYLNILDVNKSYFILKNPVQLEKQGHRNFFTYTFPIFVNNYVCF